VPNGSRLPTAARVRAASDTKTAQAIVARLWAGNPEMALFRVLVLAAVVAFAHVAE
jgi:hypothetical protein